MRVVCAWFLVVALASPLWAGEKPAAAPAPPTPQSASDGRPSADPDSTPSVASETLSEPVACDFVPGDTDGDHLEDCATQGSDGRLTLRPTALAHPRLQEPNATTVIAIGRQLYWVNSKGRGAPAFPFDNGPDYFVEGLARTLFAGKVGFVNEALEQVIAPTWDFALPFAEGFAQVCSGCVFEEVDDEHRAVVGGRWGYVDRTGRIVVAVEHERENLPAPPRPAEKSSQ